MLILFCIALTVTLMQTGSLFLIDYIPSSQSVITKINLQKLYWHNQLATATASESLETKKTIILLKEGYLDTSDLDVVRLSRLANPKLIDAIEKVKKSQQQFDQASHNRMTFIVMLKLAGDVISSYEQLDVAIHRDIESKQSGLALLQLMGLLFVMVCIVVIALEARRLLVNRLDKLNKHVSDKFTVPVEESMPDEFADLERKIFELTAQMDGYVAQSVLANKTNERVRRLINAQEFLFKFVQIMNENDLSERTLLKILYSLERAMNFNNAAIIYTNDAAVISSERVIYSHHEPTTLSKEVFGELEIAGLSKFLEQNVEDVEVCCLGVTFSGTGILLVEMDKDRFLEDSELKVLEITTKLLTMGTKFQSHDEEGRRIAVLEERVAIARELHDSLAQSFSYMKIQLARLQSKATDSADNSSNLEALSEIRECLDDAYRELRRLLTTFRAHMDVRGLGYAIQHAIDEVSQRSELPITLDNRLVNCRLTVNEEFHILHLVREALSNIVRHSGANKVSVLMLCQDDDSVVVTIDDDGIGCPPNVDKLEHHGQTIMNERAHSLGGNIEIMARRSGGTRVKLVFTPKLTH